MLKNPQKMMELVKKVGDKIKTRMDSGEISKDDIMREAGDIMKRMKEMNGGEGDDQLKEMLKNMARTMGGKGAKVDMNAFERMTKQHDVKERMKARLNKKKEAAVAAATNYVLEEKQPNNFSFKLPEEGEQPKSLVPPRFTDAELIAEFDKPTNVPKNSASKKKKKGKK